MSKHLGNVIEPMGLMDAHGADAVRWFFAASGSPWADRRIGHDALDEIVRKVLLTYWNTASFLVLYANAGGWTAAGPGGRAGGGAAAAAGPVAAVRAARVVRDVTACLGGVRHGGAPGGGSRGSSTTCRTGTCGGRGGGSGTGPPGRRERRRSPRCMNAW